ncbi:hypothetical protein Gpo141_00002182 [Globisporangium polare]
MAPKRREEGGGRGRVQPTSTSRDVIPDSSSASRGREGEGDEARVEDQLLMPLPPASAVETPQVEAARARQIQWRFWTEKVVILCDAMQIYALVWQLSQPWPWPARWLRATRWVNAFNLDFFSFRATGAAMGATSQPFSLWGEMQHYWVYALLWALLPSAGLVGFRMTTTNWRRSGRSDYLVLKMQLDNTLLQVYQILYLPIGLAVLRLVNCNADGVVSVDPVSMGGCWSGGHAAAVFIITICLGGSFLVGLPWLMHKRIHRYLAQPSMEKHERFVRSKELELALGTSETYLDLYMPLHASFLRHSVRHPVDVCTLKLALLLIFSLLRSAFPSKANQGALVCEWGAKRAHSGNYDDVVPVVRQRLLRHRDRAVAGT